MNSIAMLIRCAIGQAGRDDDTLCSSCGEPKPCVYTWCALCRLRQEIAEGAS